MGNTRESPPQVYLRCRLVLRLVLPVLLTSTQQHRRDELGGASWDWEPKDVSFRAVLSHVSFGPFGSRCPVRMYEVICFKRTSNRNWVITCGIG